jgi:hypothetical protein
LTQFRRLVRSDLFAGLVNRVPGQDGDGDMQQAAAFFDQRPIQRAK